MCLLYNDMITTGRYKFVASLFLVIAIQPLHLEMVQHFLAYSTFFERLILKHHACLAFLSYREKIHQTTSEKRTIPTAFNYVWNVVAIILRFLIIFKEAKKKKPSGNKSLCLTWFHFRALKRNKQIAPHLVRWSIFNCSWLAKPQHNQLHVWEQHWLGRKCFAICSTDTPRRARTH